MIKTSAPAGAGESNADTVKIGDLAKSLKVAHLTSIFSVGAAVIGGLVSFGIWYEGERRERRATMEAATQIKQKDEEITRLRDQVNSLNQRLSVVLMQQNNRQQELVALINAFLRDKSERAKSVLLDRVCLLWTSADELGTRVVAQRLNFDASDVLRYASSDMYQFYSRRLRNFPSEREYVAWLQNPTSEPYRNSQIVFRQLRFSGESEPIDLPYEIVFAAHNRNCETYQ